MKRADPHRRGLLRRFLAEFVRPYLGLQAEIGLCIVIGVVLGLVDPIILRAIIDGDAVKAETSMRDHLKRSLVNINQLMLGSGGET